MHINLKTPFIFVLWFVYLMSAASNAHDILHSFILEFHNNTSKPIAILDINPPALIKKDTVLEPHASSHMLILPHTTITVLFNDQIYYTHIRTKEKHPASLTFRYSSHRAYPIIEAKNIKFSLRMPKKAYQA